MFDGVPDQFHQFIAASRTSLPIPLSFPLHGASPSPSPAVAAAAPPPPPPTFPSFDHPYPSPHHHHHQTLQHVAAAAHHHQHSLHHHQKKEEQSSSSSQMLAANLVLERDRSMAEPADPWSNDEVLTLLRIRSSMDFWFPDFTWEHVSRKLAELGFKRSAEKCKEKFEEESRHFNSLSYNKNCRFFTELDELYQGENVQVLTEKNLNVEKQNEEEKEEDEEAGQSIDEDSGNNVAAVNIPSKENEEVKKPDNNSKKRKRKYKFEMVKDFCEAIVNKMMALQEELHNKLMEDMLKRDEEMIAREEAWKHQEMDRLKKEIEMRVKEQAIANDRQAMLIDFLKNFTSGPSQDHQNLAKMIEDFLNTTNCSPNISTPPCEIQPQTKISSTTTHQGNKLEMASSSSLLPDKNPSSSLPTQKNPIIIAPSSSGETPSPQDQNPRSQIHPTMVANETSSSTPSLSTQNPSSAKVHDQTPLLHTPSSSSYKGSNERSEDVGKRWPRDEVLALINLRCSLINNNNNNNDNNNNSNNNNNSDDNNRSEGAKGPLWERISQGMLQLGYKRSAKRCKEKWENINKYFRKTKDNNKKRSLDSRTCPYYHQLSTLYSQGVLVAPTDAAAVPENHRSTWPKNYHSAASAENTAELHVSDQGAGRKSTTTTAAQLPGFKFDQA